jgi:hypothetical protein
MARYRPQTRDIAPYARRHLFRSLRIAAGWIVFPIGAAIGYRESEPFFASACVGFAIAVGVFTIASITRWQRAIRRYGASYREPIEYTFRDDGIRTASEYGEAFHKRSSIRSVKERGGAFEILLRSALQPVIVPRRHLGEDEIALLRAWCAGGDAPARVPYRDAGG